MNVFDALSGAMGDQRSRLMLTLGKLCKRLRSLPPDTVVKMSAIAYSHRGYHSDIAFEPGTSQAGELLDYIEDEVIGETFCGYKGGDFTMDAHTPVWVAEYGGTGLAALAVADDGTIILAEEDDD